MRAAVAVLFAACGGPAQPEARPAAGDPPAPAGGAVASGARSLDPPAAAGAMAANLSPAGPGEALLTWVEPHGDGHRVRLSRLSGMRWQAPVTVAAGPRVVASWADTPAAVRAGDGGLFASWGESAGGHHATHLLVGRGGAGGFTRIGRAHDDASETEHGFAALLADGGGALAVWLDGRATARGEPTALRIARVAAGGVSEPGVLDRRVCDCCPTAAAETARGPVVVYRDRSEAEARDISIVRRVDGRWSAPAPVHADGWRIEGCPVSGPAVAARGQLVAVAWHTEAGGRPAVKVAFSRDGGARFGAPIEVDGGGERVPLGRVAVVLDDAGKAVVTWVAARGRAAEILARRVDDGGGAGPETLVATTGAARSAGIPRALQIGDWLLVAWSDPGARRLRARAIALREIAAPQAAADAVSGARGSTRGAAAGGPAPTEWAGKAADGRPVRIADLRGKVAVVNLWATWCGPCVAEFPHLADLHTRYARRGVEFVALSIDEEDARARVLAAWQKHGLPFTLWLDPHETAPIDWASPSIPVTLVIDRKGIVRFRRDGKITAEDRALVAAIEAALSAR